MTLDTVVQNPFVNTLTGHLDRTEISNELRTVYLEQAELSHKQARQFLGALRWIYISLAAFAIAGFLVL